MAFMQQMTKHIDLIYRSGSDSDGPSCKQRRMSTVMVDQASRSDMSRSNTPEISDALVLDVVPDNTWDNSEVCYFNVHKHRISNIYCFNFNSLGFYV